MKVECYNATRCTIASLTCGDTFYLDDTLWIKVEPFDVDFVSPSPDGRCYIVALDRGMLKSIKEDTMVTLANTKVVADTVCIGATY